MEPTFEIKIDANNISQVMGEVNSKIAKALEECGMVAETYASQHLTQELSKSPPSWYHRTGNLRNSITHIVDTEKNEMIIGTPVEYAPYVELGTGIYVAGGRRTPWGYVGNDGEVHFTRGMPPRPFIKPSIEQHIDTYEEIFKENLK